jgi:hypothetical protein
MRVRTGRAVVDLGPAPGRMAGGQMSGSAVVAGTYTPVAVVARPVDPVVERQREETRKAAIRAARRQAAERSGDPHVCLDCGTDISALQSTALRCRVCRDANERRRARHRQAAYRERSERVRRELEGGR